MKRHYFFRSPEYRQQKRREVEKRLKQMSTVIFFMIPIHAHNALKFILSLLLSKANNVYKHCEHESDLRITTYPTFLVGVDAEDLDLGLSGRGPNSFTLSIKTFSNILASSYINEPSSLYWRQLLNIN